MIYYKEMSCQVARPKGKPSKTWGQKLQVDNTWEKYYNAYFYKDYFDKKDMLDFLKALKSDLEKDLIQVEEDIKTLQKTRQN